MGIFYICPIVMYNYIRIGQVWCINCLELWLVLYTGDIESITTKLNAGFQINTRCSYIAGVQTILWNMSIPLSYNLQRLPLQNWHEDNSTPSLGSIATLLLPTTLIYKYGGHESHGLFYTTYALYTLPDILSQFTVSFI